MPCQMVFMSFHDIKPQVSPREKLLASLSAHSLCFRNTEVIYGLSTLPAHYCKSGCGQCCHLIPLITVEETGLALPCLSPRDFLLVSYLLFPKSLHQCVNIRYSLNPTVKSSVWAGASPFNSSQFQMFR